MGAPATVPLVYRRMTTLLVVVAVLLVPWTLYLGVALPARHTSQHWDLAWVGFDVALALAFAATGVSIARRSPWAPAAATAVATLLLCDAWFDNVLAGSLHEHVEAALEAGLVEIPLAAACLWLARNAEMTIAAVLRTARRLS
jgi:hypothetical protein